MRLRQDGLLEPAAVTAAWRQFLGGRAGLQEALWGILMLQAWHDAWRADAAAARPVRRRAG
jgi:hypothetical protein